MDLQFQIDTSAHRAKLKSIPIARRRKLKLILQQVGIEAVNKITALTGETAPPIKAGEGVRRKHIGGWADRTTNLVRAISSEVSVHPRYIDLQIGVLQGRSLIAVTINDVIEYAQYLDDMEGISVLGGVPEVAFQSLKKYLKVDYAVT